MFNGRHLILVGMIACAGLLSVHDGQRQIELGYKIGALEKELRGVQTEIEMCKIKHQALQAPKTVMTKVAELKLPLQPASAPAPVAAPEVRAVPRATSHSLGSPQGARSASPSRDREGAVKPLAYTRGSEMRDTRLATNVRH